MKKTIFWHALNCLAHPISILALLVVGLNALVLQIYWPSWWTGKLGDAAWMIFSPFLVTSVVIWLLPMERQDRSNRVFPLSLSLVCAGFILVKSVPGINSAVLELAKSLGLFLKLTLDPTDLIVLPFALVSWRIWREEFVITPGKPRVFAVVALSLFVVMADAAPPPSTCLLLMEDNSVVARTADARYRSQDGGITWAQDTAPAESVPGCGYMSWPVKLDMDPPLTFYYDLDDGLYQTADQGKTLTRVHVSPGTTPHVEFAISTPFDTLILSMGSGKFATRLPNGEWLQFREKRLELLLERVTE